MAAELRALVRGGVRLLPAGEARAVPAALLTGRYAPRHRIDLFDARFYLTDRRYDDDINFLVAYVVLAGRAHPRVFYKDSSLVWRVATHVIRTAGETWIGKGDVKWEERADGAYLCSAEETTNLPFELQPALDVVSRRRARALRDTDAVPLFLRSAPARRIEPYADFSGPRRRAGKVNGGRPVVRIARRGDPRSQRFAAGFEPDFAGGVLEESRSASRMYGGAVRKFRILAANREVQYQLIATPTHAWMNPPQALTTELSSYGVRTVDVLADEETFVPGYEFHFLDETLDPPELHSQIPAGFAGAPNADDPWRADAAAWNEQLPAIRAFRARVLAR